MMFLGLCMMVHGQEPMPADQLAPNSPLLEAQNDTIDTLAVEPTPQPKKEAIDAKIEYSSSDSVVITGKGIASLFGSGELNYKSMNLTAEYIRMHMDSSTLYAKGVLDTIVDEWVGKPVFTEGEESYETSEISFNFKTQKAYIRNVITEQGEGFLIADKTKKVEGDVLMMAGGKYTTCDNHDHPHFYLSLTKAKVKPGGYIATGPAYLVVGDVPLPLAIPFGFFPFTDSYSSGLIMPNFGDDYTRGLYFSGLGYYFAINDYVDLQVTGDIYSRGTWAVRAKSKYIKRYKFSGNVAVDYRWDVTGDKDMPDYRVDKNLSVQWSHTQDSKANPYSNFSASVNFKTAGYNRSNINSYYDVQANAENTTSSSVSYTQRFPDSPWSLGLSMSLTQRNKDSTLNVTLPSLTVNMSRIYPFKRKKATGKEKWYEKISLQYSGSFTNSITCKESEFFKSSFVKDWDNRLNHRLSSSASFTLFKYINITPSLSFTDRMFFSRVDQSWNEQLNQVQKDTVMGFYNVYNFNASISMSTKLYGYYIPFRKWFGDKVDRFRHVMTPSISFSYNPDFGAEFWAKRYGGFYGSYDKPVTVRDEAGNWVPKLDENGLPIYEVVNYSRFKEAPGRGASATLAFSLGNNLEMKLRNDKDTTGKEPYKVYSIIDNLSISGGYNFIADSMNWSNFSVNLRIKIPKVNYTINLSGQFDPYMYTTTASGAHVRCNELYWNHGRFPHFLGTSTSFSYTFNNDVVKKWFEKKDTGTPPEEEIDEENMDGLEDEPLQNKRNRNDNGNKDEVTDDGYLFAKIPWSLSVSYSLRYMPGPEWNEKKNYYKMEFRHNLSFSASLGLGSGWKASTTLSYDVNAKKMAYTSINVTRDLHCWSMSASFVPFGPFKSYTFHIGVNASMLADLKYDKSSTDATGKKIDWW
ncbi:MAG: putative LPS assembly protein LptD [Paludibacteraceae bacterium]|nr:putative LPS assembly protein LptD [Paludibacteraceae bacterium]